MLEVKNLTVYAKFFRRTKRIVKNISFDVENGQMLGIIGKSGIGKSMIAGAITGTLAENCFSEGEILLDGVDLTNKKNLKIMLGKKLVYLPQGGAESLNPSLKIKRQIYEAFDVSTPNLTFDEKKSKVKTNLLKLSLDDSVLEKYPFEISGGEAQRVMLCIAMCASPISVVSDEPTRGLDQNNKKIFIDCLRENFSEASLVVITHDDYVIARCDKVFNVDDSTDSLDDENEGEL